MAGNIPPHRSRSFIKMIRSNVTLELIKNYHREFLLLTLIAYRAKRTPGFSPLELEPGEALIGDHESCGLTQRQYRTAKKKLEKWGFATFKATNKGTIAKIINTDVYDINCDAIDNQIDNQPTSKRQASDKQATTNKKVKERKEIKTFSSDSIEIRLSKLLFQLILTNNPKNKKPKLEEWAKHVDLAMRIDRRSPEDIEAVIRWCQSHHFWHRNILSTEKLRKQFDKLFIEMQAEQGNGQHSGSAPPRFQDPTCPHCQVSASNIERGMACPYCGEMVAGKAPSPVYYSPLTKPILAAPCHPSGKRTPPVCRPGVSTTQKKGFRNDIGS